MEHEYEQNRPLPTARDVVGGIFRQRWVIITSFCVLLLAMGVSGIFNRKYEAHMKILVLRQRLDPMVTAKADEPALIAGGVSEEELNSEVELLKSDDLLRTVVSENGVVQRIVGVSGAVEGPTLATAARRLGRDLDIQAIRKTNVIVVRYRSSNRADLEPVLNAVANAYIQKHREVHRASGEFTFFDQQAEFYKKGLTDAQNSIVDYTKKSGVVAAQMERDLTLQRLAEFEAIEERATTEIAETKQQINSMEAQIGGLQPRLTTEIKTSENPQLMQQMKSTLLNLELKRTELLTRFEPSYPAVQEVERQIRDTKTSIAAEINAPPKQETTDIDPTYAMLRTDLAKAEAQLAGLEARSAATSGAIARYRQNARSLEQVGIEQGDLERQAKTQEENYVLYSRKREEARISDALDQRGILNVSIAERPLEPSSPAQSPVMLGLVAFFLSGIGSLGLGLFADRVAPTFRSPDEVTACLHLPVIASLPK